MRSTMRKSVVLCVCCLLASCAWFESREARARKLVESQLQGIDWNDVDQYPLFEDCDETAAKAAQRACFEETLLLHFSRTLEDFEFLMAGDVEDTLYMDFIVDREGTIAVMDIERNNEVANQIPEFNGVITQSLKSLPRVDPALKRGIPVNAKFRIPLVLNTN
jgi:hypothetical protein